ncbi:MAG: Sec-independent protein translocase protein TatB [Arenimonas sp.]|nr:Sec-independent protein translocase protein TatB [Arenimonas sp.]
MFDIGFSELLVIAVVALLVLGPERLPKAARFAGLWVRKARAQWYSVKSEFEREMASDELKRSVGNPLDDLRSAVSEAGKELDDAGRNFGDALRDTQALATADADAATAVQDIPAAAPATAETPPVIASEAAPGAAPVQAGLDDFEFYTDPEPAPPAPGRSDPSPP